MAYYFFIILAAALSFSAFYTEVTFLIPLLLIIITALSLINYQHREKLNNSYLLISFLTAGIIYGLISFTDFQNSHFRKFIGRKVAIRGTLSGDSVAHDEFAVFSVKAGILTGDIETGKNFNFRVITNEKKFLPQGSRVFIEGILAPLEKTAPFYKIAEIEGVKGVLFADKIEETFQPEELSFFVRLKRVIQSSIASTSISNETLSFVYALLLGDKKGINKKEYQKFSTLNVLHLLTVSGIHFAIIALFIDYFMRLFRLSYIKRIPLTLIWLLVFLGLTGFPPAASRAFIMITIYFLAIFLYRKPDPMHVIGCSGLILLLLKPSYVFYPGFILSFTITSFIAGPWRKIDRLLTLMGEKNIKYIQLENRDITYAIMHNKFIKLIYFSFFIWLFSLPLCLLFFGVSSFYSPFVNIIFALLIPGIFMLSLAGSVLGIFLPALGSLIFTPVEVAVGFLKNISDVFYQLPFSAINAQSFTLLDCLSLYLVVVIIIELFYRIRLNLFFANQTNN